MELFQHDVGPALAAAPSPAQAGLQAQACPPSAKTGAAAAWRPERRRDLGERRGGEDSPYSRQGTENLNFAALGKISSVASSSIRLQDRRFPQQR